jgi:hypothetical protein
MTDVVWCGRCKKKMCPVKGGTDLIGWNPEAPGGKTQVQFYFCNECKRMIGIEVKA